MTAAMDPKTPSQSPNPSSKHNVYHIGGVPVEFPHRPYGSQLAFMGRVISTLDRARWQGHCHALLESPTGTGKSLALLCFSVAWQQHQRSILLATLTQPTPDPLLHGGGFIPEPTMPSRNSEQLRALGLRRDCSHLKFSMPCEYCLEFCNCQNNCTV
uniref:Regulator of telomere elongation helicase 1 homolog isoform X1 n=2 Tax=Elaeis guineensis var. tenera TaxID=51953 RepID=A0A8N4F2N7_ELAGV|nr:regulator of telomere elongation helicase 1 homolog isoform X1 [Elaeis guineensis]